MARKNNDSQYIPTIFLQNFTIPETSNVSRTSSALLENEKSNTKLQASPKGRVRVPLQWLAKTTILNIYPPIFLQNFTIPETSNVSRTSSALLENEKSNTKLQANPRGRVRVPLQWLAKTTILNIYPPIFLQKFTIPETSNVSRTSTALLESEKSNAKLQASLRGWVRVPLQWLAKTTILNIYPPIFLQNFTIPETSNVSRTSSALLENEKSNTKLQANPRGRVRVPLQWLAKTTILNIYPPIFLQKFTIPETSNVSRTSTALLESEKSNAKLQASLRGWVRVPLQWLAKTTILNIYPPISNVSRTSSALLESEKSNTKLQANPRGRVRVPLQWLAKTTILKIYPPIFLQKFTIPETSNVSRTSSALLENEKSNTKLQANPRGRVRVPLQWLAKTTILNIYPPIFLQKFTIPETSNVSRTSTALLESEKSNTKLQASLRGWVRVPLQWLAKTTILNIYPPIFLQNFTIPETSNVSRTSSALLESEKSNTKLQANPRGQSQRSGPSTFAMARKNNDSQYIPTIFLQNFTIPETSNVSRTSSALLENEKSNTKLQASPKGRVRVPLQWLAKTTILNIYPPIFLQNFTIPETSNVSRTSSALLENEKSNTKLQANPRGRVRVPLQWLAKTTILNIYPPIFLQKFTIPETSNVSRTSTALLESEKSNAKLQASLRGWVRVPLQWLAKTTILNIYPPISNVSRTSSALLESEKSNTKLQANPRGRVRVPLQWLAKTTILKIYPPIFLQKFTIPETSNVSRTSSALLENEKSNTKLQANPRGRVRVPLQWLAKTTILNIYPPIFLQKFTIPETSNVSRTSTALLESEKSNTKLQASLRGQSQRSGPSTLAMARKNNDSQYIPTIFLQKFTIPGTSNVSRTSTALLESEKSNTKLQASPRVRVRVPLQWLAKTTILNIYPPIFLQNFTIPETSNVSRTSSALLENEKSNTKLQANPRGRVRVPLQWLAKTTILNIYPPIFLQKFTIPETSNVSRTSTALLESEKSNAKLQASLRGWVRVPLQWLAKTTILNIYPPISNVSRTSSALLESEKSNTKLQANPRGRVRVPLQWLAKTTILKIYPPIFLQKFTIPETSNVSRTSSALLENEKSNTKLQANPRGRVRVPLQWLAKTTILNIYPPIFLQKFTIPETSNVSRTSTALLESEKSNTKLQASLRGWVRVPLQWLAKTTILNIYPPIFLQNFTIPETSNVSRTSSALLESEKSNTKLQANPRGQSQRSGPSTFAMARKNNDSQYIPTIFLQKFTIPGTSNVSRTSTALLESEKSNTKLQASPRVRVRVPLQWLAKTTILNIYPPIFLQNFTIPETSNVSRTSSALLENEKSNTKLQASSKGRVRVPLQWLAKTTILNIYPPIFLQNFTIPETSNVSRTSSALLENEKSNTKLQASPKGRVRVPLQWLAKTTILNIYPPIFLQNFTIPETSNVSRTSSALLENEKSNTKLQANPRGRVRVPLQWLAKTTILNIYPPIFLQKFTIPETSNVSRTSTALLESEKSNAKLQASLRGQSQRSGPSTFAMARKNNDSQYIPTIFLQKFTIPGTSNVSRTSTALLESEKSNTKLQASPRVRVRVPLQWLAKTTILNIYPPIFLQNFTIPETSNVSRTSSALLENEKSNTKLQASSKGRVRVPLQWLAKTTILNIYPPIFLQNFTIPETSNVSRTSSALLENEKSNTKLQASPKGRVRVPLQWLAKTTILNIYPPIFLQNFTIPETSNVSRTSSALLENEKSNTKLQANPRGRVRVPLQWLAKTTILNIYPPIFLQKFTIPETSNVSRTSTALLESEKSNAKLQASLRGWVRVPLQWLAKTTILNIYPPISNVSRTSSALLESEKSNTKLQANPRGRVRVPLQWLAKTTILKIYPPIFLQKFTIPETSNVSRTSSALLENEKSNTKLQANPRGQSQRLGPSTFAMARKNNDSQYIPTIFLQKFTIPGTSNVSRTSTALLESEKSNTKLQASPRVRVRVPLQWLAKTTILNIYPPIFLQNFTIPETSNVSRTSSALLENEKSNTKLQASPKGRVRVPLQWLAKTTILNIYPPIFLQNFTIPETSNVSRTSSAPLENEKSNTKLQANPRGRVRVPLQWLAKTTILNIYPPIFLQKFTIPETSNVSRTSTALLESEKSNAKLQASLRGWVRVPLQWLAKTTILNIYPPIFLQNFTIPETSNVSRTSSALLESEKSNTKLQANPRGRVRVPLQWLAKTTILNIYPPYSFKNSRFRERQMFLGLVLLYWKVRNLIQNSRPVLEFGTSSALLENEKSNTKLQASSKGRVRVPLQWLAKTTILNIYPPIFLQNFTIPETSNVSRTSSALLENEKSNTKLQASPKGRVRVPLQWLAKTTILNIYPPIFLQNFTIPETSNVSRTSSALLENEKSNTKLQANPRGRVRVPLQWLAKTTILNIYPPIFLQKFTIPETSNVSRTSTALLESEKSNAKLQASLRGWVRVPLQWLAKTTILNIYPPISNVSRTSSALLESEKSNTKLQANPRGRVRVPLQWLAKTTILKIYPPIFLQKFTIPETSNVSRTSSALLENEKSNTKLQANPRGQSQRLGPSTFAMARKNNDSQYIPTIFLQKFTIPGTSNVSRTSTALLESEKSNTKLQASPRVRVRVPLQWLAKTTILNIYPPIFLQNFTIPETSNVSRTSSALLENEKSNTKLQANPRGRVRVPLQWLAKTTILNIYPPIFLQKFTIPETSNVSRTSTALLESEKSNTKLQASLRGWVRVPLQWLAKTTILNIYPPIFLQNFTIPETSNVSRTSSALLENEKSNTKLQASPKGRVRVPLQWLAKTTILNIYPPIFLQKFTIPETSNVSRTSSALLENEKSNTKLQANPRGRVRVPLQWLAKTTILNIYPPIFLQKFTIPETSNVSRTSTALLESEKSNTKLQASLRGWVRVPLQWLAKTTILNIYPPIFFQNFTIPETSNVSRTSSALLENEKSNTKLQASPKGRVRVPLQWLAKTTILNIYPPIFLQKFTIPETSNVSRTSSALLENEKSNTKLQANPRGRVRVPLQWLAKTTILNIYPPIFLQKFTIPETSNVSRTSTALLESEKSNTKLQASPRVRVRVPLQWLAKTTILNIYPPIFLQKFTIPETSNVSRTSTALLESEKSNAKLQASLRGWVRVPLQWLAKTTILNIYPPISNVSRTSSALLESEKSNTKLQANPRGRVRVPLQWLAKTTILKIYPPIFLQKFTIPETSNVSRTSSALLENEKSNTKLQANPRGQSQRLGPSTFAMARKNNDSQYIPTIFLQKFTIPGTSNVSRTSTALLESEKSNTKLQASPRVRVRVPLQWLAKTTILNIYPPIFLQNFTIPETSNVSRTSSALLENEKSNTKLQANPRGRVRVPLQWLAKTTILNIYPPIFLQKFTIPETSNVSRTSTALLESEKSNTKLQASLRGWVRVPLQWLAKTTILNIYPPIFLQNFTIPETSNVSRTSSALLENEKSNTKLQASPKGRVRVPLQWLAKTTILNIYPPIFLQKFTILETSNVSRTSSALLENEKSNTKLQANPRGRVRVPLQWLAKTTILNIYPPIFLQKFTIPETSNVSRTSTALLESEKSNTKLQASLRGWVRVPLQWLAKTTILNIYPPIFLQNFTIPETSNVSRTSSALLENEKSNTKLQASPKGRVRVPLQWLAKTTILNIYPPIFLQKFTIPETSNVSRTSSALLENEKSNTKLQANPRGRVRVPLQWLAKTTILNIYPPIFLQKFTIPETSNVSRTSTALLESEKSNTKLQASLRGWVRVPLQWLAKTTILNIYPPIFLQNFTIPETSNVSRTSSALLESEKSNTKLQANPRGRVRVPLQWLAKTTILKIYPPIFLQKFTIPETSNVSRTSSALLENEKSNTKLQANPRGRVRVPLQWLAKTTILNIYPPIFLQKFTIPETSNVSRTSTALLESEKSNTKLQASLRGWVRVPLQWLAKTTILNIYPPIFLQNFTIPETSNVSRTSSALLESEKSNTNLQANPRGRVRVPLQWLAKTTILKIYPPIFLQKFTIPETSNVSSTSTALLESEKSNTKLQASLRGWVRVPLQWLAKTTILNIYPPIFLQNFTIPETSNVSRTSSALLESEKSNTKLQASPRGWVRVPLQWLAKTTILNIYPPIFLQNFTIPETSNVSRTSSALLESEKSNTKLQASPRGWVRVPLQWLAKTTILNIYPPYSFKNSRFRER
ncbi:unnamed protein product [Cylicocyclus nassatus]|uniref:Uncharacterized protein n=1 Tax=Cylicocyclus nassatus TaxID=53992 RepID=A0AA36DI24_CYLNA|nr:unnamed protein product [Cylicocyclus nassatus]